MHRTFLNATQLLERENVYVCVRITRKTELVKSDGIWHRRRRWVNVLHLTFVYAPLFYASLYISLLLFGCLRCMSIHQIWLSIPYVTILDNETVTQSD